MTDEVGLDIIRPARPVGWEHAPEVYELAFLCFIESDRHVARAMRRFDETADETMPRPAKSVWYEWAKRDNWNVRADDAIAAAFPNIRRRQLARLVVLIDRAQDFDAAVLAGDYDHQQGALAEKGKASARVQQLGALGTAGARGGDPSLSAQSTAEQDEAMTPAERQRRILERAKGNTR